MSIFKDILGAASSIINGSKKEDGNQNWYNDDEVDKENSEKIDPELNVEEEVENLEKPVWVHPVQIQRVTSPYGWRILLGKKVWNNGTYFSGKNKDCYAPVDCVVVKTLEYDKEYPFYFAWDNRQQAWVIDKKVPKGRAWTPYVVVQCAFDKSIRFVYRHLGFNLTVGQKLYAGDVVGEVNNYGYSMGAHLHFEVLLADKKGNYNSTDPVKFLASKLKDEHSGNAAA
jgi:murein DD-endopeptidase MepM/ murein hydrolase activator NlpD